MQKPIPVACPVLNGNEKKYVMECIETGWISSVGKYIKPFEQKFSSFCNTRHAISCGNGTVALHLALLAYDVGPGDEIIVPTLGYVAVANAVTYCGAQPIFVDSEPETWNIDPNQIEKKISHKTKGIIVVHLYGHPVDMEPIMEITKKHNLFLIEDAAEAHGALYKNRVVGSIGDIGTFSFYGNKIITTDEGGMVVTNNNKIAEKIRILKGQGMDPGRRYWFPIIGYNYRMTNIQAAIGLAQLENISWHLDKRREIANLYYKHLREFYDFIELPKEKEWARHSFWMFSILLRDSVKLSRDEFMHMLAKDGIETRPVFYPMHVLPPYNDFQNDHFSIANSISSRGLNLPMYSNLKKKEIEFISKKIKKIIFTK